MAARRTALVLLGVALACGGCGRQLHVALGGDETWRWIELADTVAAGELRGETVGRRYRWRLDLPETSPNLPLTAVEAWDDWSLALIRRPAGGATLVIDGPWRLPAEVSAAGPDVMVRFGWNQTVHEVGEDPPGQPARRHWTADGRPYLVVVLAVPPERCRDLAVVTAGPTIRLRQSMDRLTRDAEVGINGGYFDLGSGAPLGALKVDGEWIKPPLYDRTALLLPRAGPPRIEVVSWRGVVATGAGELRIDAFNSTPTDGDDVAVTTPRWGGPKRFAGFEAAPLDDGEIVHSRRPLTPPLRVIARSEPDVDGSILGAGPRLVRAGSIDLTAVAERFRADITEPASARSAVGLLADGTVLLAAAECHPPDSGGVHLDEWAGVMRALDCVDAMNLDGATMTALLWNRQPLVRPQADQAQPVATALVLRRP